MWPGRYFLLDHYFILGGLYGDKDYDRWRSGAGDTDNSRGYV